jgi:glucose uptake protein GlcU
VDNCVVLHGWDAMFIFLMGFIAAVVLILGFYWWREGRRP